ncbi:unknown [Azospirillum sp. CAG:239]|nr:unknown [Azospirillum sp. CAG:239]
MKKIAFSGEYIYTNMLNICTLAQFIQKCNRQNLFVLANNESGFNPCLCRAVLLYSGNSKIF